ncbi:MAG TPA: LPXTG cell wall anchor domain-containing protein [Thermoanaerobaculia bacterium]|jgi:LPXTG-motif cell wall-anchored protein|nr:LPXTG cell wall anchor domain-containing protein [Thermoanaerobaculia bacterium]
MKRFILASSTMFLLTAGAAMAQNPLNTTAPGPTQEKLPGQTNNDLPNPGHPIAAPTTGVQSQPVTENGTTEGTAAESMQRDQTGTTTGTTGSMSTTSTMDNTTSTSTTTTGMNDTTGTSTTHVRAHRLPRTGSEMPLVALLGLTSLAGFAVLRASRNA